MQKSELLLAALAAGEGKQHTPVQVQKLLFLIQKQLAAEIGGEIFNFAPYDYGPFDSSVYEELRKLEADGLVVGEPTNRGWKKYRLTEAGQAQGVVALTGLQPRISAYIGEVSKFVLSLGFADLVSAVYKAYPEMKVNSVFRG